MGLVQQEHDGVAEFLGQQTTVQMPDVLGPDPLGLVVVDQLAEDGLDAVAQAAESGAKTRSRIPLP